MSNTTPSPSVSKKVRYLRENNGLSTDELATALGITISQLDEIEAGSTQADNSLLEKIALTLQVPLSYLVEQNMQDNASLSYLTRAMEKLSSNDHDQLLQFAEFLQSAPKEK